MNYETFSTSIFLLPLSFQILFNRLSSFNSIYLVIQFQLLSPELFNNITLLLMKISVSSLSLNSFGSQRPTITHKLPSNTRSEYVASCLRPITGLTLSLDNYSYTSPHNSVHYTNALISVIGNATRKRRVVVPCISLFLRSHTNDNELVACVWFTALADTSLVNLARPMSLDTQKHLLNLRACMEASCELIVDK